MNKLLKSSAAISLILTAGCGPEGGGGGGTPDPEYTHYEDLDSDGFGNPLNFIVDNEPIASGSYVDNDFDCDDTDDTIYEGAPEMADGLDNDCLNGPDDGISDRIIFASSGFYTGDFAQYDLVGADGITGADIKCQELADNAGLPQGIYRAWLSTSTSNVVDRLIQSPFPYVLTDGTQVAADFNSLINAASVNLLNIIDLDETGVRPPTNPYLVSWTGTDEFGEALTDTCLDWTSPVGTDLGVHGGMLSVNGQWTSFSGTGIACSFATHVYCLQQ